MATDHELDPWRDIDEMEMTTSVLIDSMCGCSMPGHSHGNDVAPWKHDKGCQLYQAPESSPDAEPHPYEVDDVELKTSVWIKSNCACIGCNLHLDKYPTPDEPKRVQPHQHDSDCHLYQPEPSPGHDPYAEHSTDLDLTALVLIRSLCACTHHDPMKPAKPCDHDKDCHIFVAPEASFYLPLIVWLFPSNLGVVPLQLG